MSEILGRFHQPRKNESTNGLGFCTSLHGKLKRTELTTDHALLRDHRYTTSDIVQAQQSAWTSLANNSIQRVKQSISNVNILCERWKRVFL